MKNRNWRSLFLVNGNISGAQVCEQLKIDGESFNVCRFVSPSSYFEYSALWDVSVYFEEVLLVPADCMPLSVKQFPNLNQQVQKLGTDSK